MFRGPHGGVRTNSVLTCFCLPGARPGGRKAARRAHSSLFPPAAGEARARGAETRYCNTLDAFRTKRREMGGPPTKFLICSRVCKQLTKTQNAQKLESTETTVSIVRYANYREATFPTFARAARVFGATLSLA